MTLGERRFVHAVLGEGARVHVPDDETRIDGVPPSTRPAGPVDALPRAQNWFPPNPDVRHWPFPPHAGMRTACLRLPATGGPRDDVSVTPDAFVLVGAWGGGLAAIELAAGLDLWLPEAWPDELLNRSDHLLGQLIAPETNPPEKRNTVQVRFAEDFGAAAGTESFGIVKLRGKVVWRHGRRHVLLFHRQMPTGWPDPAHPEADESALTGRTAALPLAARIWLGLPMLTHDRTRVLEVQIGGLVGAAAWIRARAAA